jgi:arylsulfatase A-like enzyme
MRSHRLLAAISAIALVACGSPVSDPPAPRAFLISMDAASAFFYGSYGAGDGASPRIDELAADSVVFENAYSQSASTPPSVASLLSGVRATTHRVRGKGTLPETFPTLVQLLSQAGFRTFGVIGNPFAGAARLGFARGYDEIVQVYALPELQELRARESTSGFTVPVPGDINEQAERLLPRVLEAVDAGTPVFAYIHYLQPHKPYDPPASYLDPTEGERSWDALHDHFLRGNATGQATPETIGRIEARYRGNVAYVDAAIGELLDRLRRDGLYDDSLIVLMADHGDAFFKHKRFGHNKTVYDDMTRIPLLFKFPVREGIVPRRLSQLVETVDITRTLLDYLGAEQPEHLEGESLMPLVRGEVEALSRPEVVVATSTRSVHGIRVRDYKYIYNESGGEELYDLRDDPDEQRNLVDEQHDRARALRAKLESMVDLEDGRSIEEDNRLREDPRMDDLLEALGYIEGEEP